VFQILNYRDTNRTQNFTYDAFNRIATAYTTSSLWGEDFTIDAWGNLTNRALHAGKTEYEPLNAAPATNQNRLTGFGYDAAGNMTSNSPNTYTYDDENRLTNTAGVTYTYDGDGQRVVSSAGTLYRRGLDGEVLRETDLAGNGLREYVFFGGKRVARLNLPSTVRYFFSDHLGSTNVVTGATGTNIAEESDFYPYGGERVITDTLGNQNYKFTGKERDSESGLDYFGARHYTSSLGRFMTPDWSEEPEPLPYGNVGDPQSLNLYSYVRNNPLNSTDQDGHQCHSLPNGDVHCEVHEEPPPEVHYYILAGVAMENEELGPLAWGTAALLLTAGCIHTHCWNVFFNQDTNNAPQADAPSDAKQADAPPNAPDSKAADDRPPNVPADWVKQPSKKGGGTVYVDPKNPHNRVRVMPGNPNSPNPAQRQPYMKVQVNGQTVDANGNPVPSDSPEAHIPLSK
jgi:RHS repeat-associated protein